MSTKGTPRTPWHASGNWIMSQDGMVCYLNSIEVRGQFTEEQRDATAAHIVHCVNQHPSLLAALKDCISQIKALCSESDVPDSATAALAAAEPKAEGKG